MRFRIKQVEPTGTRKGGAFVNRAGGRGGYEILDFPVYPPSPEGEMLRKARVEGALGLRKAAARLALTAVQLSDLETGRGTFVEDDWEEAAKILRGQLRRRADGWPICPACNEDELGCLDMRLEEWERAKGNLDAYLRRALFCYRCAHTYPAGTFDDVEVTT